MFNRIFFLELPGCEHLLGLIHLHAILQCERLKNALFLRNPPLGTGRDTTCVLEIAGLFTAVHSQFSKLVPCCSALNLFPELILSSYSMN